MDESGNPRIWNDAVWMAVCMRSVWHPDGADSYAFMRKISRSTWIASFAALLIVFDFMHFTLSRIGTIDVIVGFFILLTFYLMYLVLDDLKMGCSWKTVCLMILNGMAAGAAMASKWTGVYACAGIAVLFFTFLFREYGTAAARTRKGMSGQAAISYLAGLSVICIVAYLLIPAVIYVASYLSYGNGMGNGMFSRLCGKSAAYASLPWENGV